MDTETIVKHFQAGSLNEIELGARPGWRPAKPPCGECLETVLRQAQRPLDGQTARCIGCDNVITAVWKAAVDPISRWGLVRRDVEVTREPTALVLRVSQRGASFDLRHVFTHGRADSVSSWTASVKKASSNPLLVRLDEHSVIVLNESVAVS